MELPLGSQLDVLSNHYNSILPNQSIKRVYRPATLAQAL